MAPKFPNPDPATDSVRDRLDQFIQVAGRAVYPPLAVAPSPTTPGQIWWDISSTVKIRDEANTAWASLATTMGAVSFREAQSLTSGEKTQALSNIGAQPAGSYQPSGGYVRYDASQTLTSPQLTQIAQNAKIITANASPDGGGILDFRCDNGHTYRLIQGTVNKAASPTVYTIDISYGITFLNVPLTIVSNGDASARPYLIVGAYNTTVSGFSILGVNADGSGSIGIENWRANYMVLGRIA